MTESVSRRGLFLRLKPGTAHLEKTASKRPIRPPHAIDELRFLTTCDGCKKCAQACPHGSVFLLKTDDVSDGTPVLSPAERPCHLCDNRPCVEACPTGALSLETPLQSFGIVEILKEHCFTFRGPECGACGVCPGEIHAVRFVRNRPQIDTQRCMGCGLCIEACPTTPISISFQKLQLSGLSPLVSD